MNIKKVDVVDVLKFDIEGEEFDLFQSFSRMHVIRYLIGEFHQDLCHRTLEEFLTLLPTFEPVRVDHGKKRSFVILKNRYFLV